MAWLKLTGSDDPFRARFPIAVNASALGSSTNKDVLVTVPPTLELFWASLGTDGYDLRVTDADGITVIQHKLSTDFNHGNRVCEMAMLPLLRQCRAP